MIPGTNLATGIFYTMHTDIGQLRQYMFDSGYFRRKPPKFELRSVNKDRKDA